LNKLVEDGGCRDCGNNFHAMGKSSISKSKQRAQTPLDRIRTLEDAEDMGYP
jgi:hypothetical protein